MPVMAPFGNTIVYHQETAPVLYWQCYVCRLVWMYAVPDGHVCEKPIDPTLAWPA